MKAEIISIGTELLLGHILNTNTAFLSQKLAENGIDVYNTSVVGDNPQRLIEALNQAVRRSNIVITTGGLGPTVDDITIETVAKFIGKPLILNKMVLKCLKDYFEFRKVKFPAATMRQAYTPEGVRCVRNKVGTAPGMIVDWKDKVIICLPGPPRELESMFVNDILPYISRGRLNVPYAVDNYGSWVIKTRTIKITGLAESVVNKKVKKILESKPPTTVGIYAKLGQVELKIMSKAVDEKTAARSIAAIEKNIRAKLNGYIFGCDKETLEDAVGGLLVKKRMTIGVAESCTGGLLSNRLTDVSGSSKYFTMGVVTYSNSSKENLLAIRREVLQKHGAVSKEVALAMAKGAMWLSCADIGVGITGIAGPTGGTRSKPVGLIYIAIVTDKKSIVKEMRFKGSREEIKFLSSQVALDLIRKNI